MSRLWDIVEDYGAIFLLSYMRESRWLPTVMARSLVNNLIKVALILDEWIAMQHGVSGSASDCLGCSFCGSL